MKAKNDNGSLTVTLEGSDQQDSTVSKHANQIISIKSMAMKKRKSKEFSATERHSEKRSSGKHLVWRDIFVSSRPFAMVKKKKKKKKTAKSKPPTSGFKVKSKSKTLRNSRAGKKKKQKKKDDSSSDSSSSSDEQPSKPTENPAPTSARLSAAVLTLPKSKEPQPMPGFIEIKQPENYLINLIADERADLGYSEKLTATEADCLDKYLKEHSELQNGDEFIYDKTDETKVKIPHQVQYEVKSKYSEGRYSALYIVFRSEWKNNKQIEDKGIYMMKTQLRKGSTRSPHLIKREVACLTALTKNRRKVCTTMMVDHGKICDMSYIVMNLVDKNLEVFRREVGYLSMPTIYHVAMEALQGLQELHSKKYIHRDIKPANLAFGMGKDRLRVFLLDFGDAVKTTKIIKMGVPDAFTLPYWSLDCHRKVKTTGKTDVESWLYTIWDLSQAQGVPWKENLKAEEVAKAKTQFWKEYRSQLPDSTFVQLAEIVANVNTAGAPYARLNAILTEALIAKMNGAKFVPDWKKT